jgi:hypothetical protein
VPKAGAAAEVPELPARRKSDTGQNASALTTPEIASETASNVMPAQGISAQGAADVVSPRSEVAATHAGSDSSDVDDGRSKRQRMATAARDAVEEKLSPRVEKLRHASNVMLEEASYDPSLRFVLVAIIIVLLSLLLLLLNYLLG